MGKAGRKRWLGIRPTVAARLGNTPTICRKCYVHPEIFDCYLDEALVLEIAAEAEAAANASGALRPDEAAVLALLQQRLKRMREEQKAA